MKETIAKLKIMGAMGIFGTVGLFVRLIPMASAQIAFWRGIIGFLFLLIYMFITNKRPSMRSIRKNAWVLCLSGIAIGGNWILLFEAYRYTTVATATVCYYMAPVLVVLASPLIGEKLRPKRLCCVAVALVGLVMVSGVMENGLPSAAELSGVLFGLGAAVLYASVMLLNKKLKHISGYDRTLAQLLVSAVVVLPYILFTGGFGFAGMTTNDWVVLAVVGVVHTGVAYALYFDSMRDLKAQSVALFSYLDPVVAILLSTLVLREHFSLLSACGTVLILGSAAIAEQRKKR